MKADCKVPTLIVLVAFAATVAATGYCVATNGNDGLSASAASDTMAEDGEGAWIEH